MKNVVSDKKLRSFKTTPAKETRSQRMRLFPQLFSILLALLVIAVTAVQSQEEKPIIRLDPALDQIISLDSKLEKLPDSSGPGPREGPLWIEKGAYLLYSDIGGKFITRWNSGDNQVSVFLESSNSNGLTLDRQGRLVFVATGRVVRLEKDGRLTILASEYDGKPLAAPNDLVYKSDGALYFTDPNKPAAHTPYVYLLRKSKLQLLTVDMDFPNGLAFSPDEKYLYVDDMMRMTIWKFDVLHNDTIAHGQLLIDEDPDKKNAYPGGTGNPDGMKVDKKGNIYCTGPGGVWIISAEGKHLGTISVPARTTNLAFGERDGKTLFITSRPSVYRIRVNISGIRP